MAKQNAFLARMEAIYKRKMEERVNFAVHQSMHMSMIALHDTFGFGADRLVKFGEAYEATWNSWAAAVNSDAKEDKDAVYSLEKYEQKLKQILGKYYVAKDERD